jgi:hypothetical protein
MFRMISTTYPTNLLELARKQPIGYLKLKPSIAQHDTIMQVLWSRAAQTRSSCRCRSCVNAGTTVARRTTTAVNRRKLKIGDLFTACYSTILATAAFADARRKEDRRKEWDRVIAEVKRESDNKSDKLGQKSTNAHKDSFKDISTAADIPFNGSVSQAGAPNPMFLAWDSISSTLAGPSSSAPLTTRLSALETQLKSSPVIATQESLDSTAVAPEIIRDWLDDDDPDSLLPERGYQSFKHLRKAGEMIAKLVSQLLITSNAQSLLITPQHDTSAQTKAMLDRFAALHSEEAQLPEYTHRSTEEVEQDREMLHTTLATVFINARAKPAPMELVIAKVCYNLLVSTTPPSVTTYNILLRGFTQLQQYDLGDLVVRSLFSESRFRLNPATARIMLEYYIAKGDKVGFRSIVNRMRGLDDGMQIRRRLIYALDSPEVKQWALTAKVIHRGPYLYEKFPRNSRVFNALIQGSLEFNATKPAILFVHAAIREGQQINPQTLLKLVNNCTANRAVKIGWSLLSTILSEWETNVFPIAVDYCMAVRYAIYQLLSLCGINFLPFLEGRGPLENAGGLAITTRHRVLLETMLNHMRIERLVDRVEDFSRIILKLQGIFRISHERMDENYISPYSLALASAAKVDFALKTLTKNFYRRNGRSRGLNANVAEQRENILQSQVALEVARSANFIRNMQKQVLSIYLKKLPFHLQQGYTMIERYNRPPRKLYIISRLYKQTVLDGVTTDEEPLAANNNIAEIDVSSADTNQSERLDLQKLELPWKSSLPDVALLHAPTMPLRSRSNMRIPPRQQPEYASMAAG